MKKLVETKVYRNSDGTCRANGCNNKEYKVDWLSPYLGSMLCKRHWDEVQ